MRVKGRVVGGLGVGGKYVAHPYYSIAFERILGCKPYPGTLNLDTDTDWRMLASHCLPEIIEETVWDGVRLGAVYVWRVASITPCREECPPARIVLIRPLLSRHPHNILELVSCFKLRPLLTSEAVEIEVMCRENPLYTKSPRLPRQVDTAD